MFGSGPASFQIFVALAMIIEKRQELAAAARGGFDELLAYTARPFDASNFNASQVLGTAAAACRYISEVEELPAELSWVVARH